jgi:hypothetical protein
MRFILGNVKDAMTPRCRLLEYKKRSEGGGEIVICPWNLYGRDFSG